MRKFLHQKETGLSLIEVLIVLSLLSLVLGIVVVNLFRPSSEAKLRMAASDLVSTLNDGQSKAMNTDTQGSPQPSEFGVHFETKKYILFQGSTFDGSDPKNFVIDTPGTISITSNLPCPSAPNNCNNVVFQKISGEVANFDAANNTICINETSTGKNILITVNFVGVLDIQNGC